ncbi:hypothetical protein SASPL_114683 [Salvia splendens]|uniref:Ubiquitin-like protease family profile domain-containing protein n=1 Tax=Salvia splendens TaxID=180675 RepID=A0A8X8Y1T5_SALSN|nr:hypothetical protein SASPL_114683 [Salvia splendens]
MSVLWSSTRKRSRRLRWPQQQIPDDCAVGSARNLLPENFIQEDQQQGNEEKSVDVYESGVGSSSQNILPSHMVANVVKYIKQISDGRTNLLRVLKEASSQIENNDLFGLICDIARSAIGSQKSPVASVSDIFLHLSQSYNIGNDVAVDNWKALFDSIRNAEKANETIEDLNEFPTFRLDDFFDKAVEQRNKDNLPTSLVGVPEEVRQTVEEDKQRKENMICDDHNESNSPISTAVLGSPRTASPSLQQQEVNASDHDNTLASLIGSENMGNELDIQEEVEADRELRTQDAWHILSKVCSDCEISNNEEAIKATNIIFDIINEQVFFPVFTSGYYYLVVFWMKINKIEIIDSVKPPKAKDPLEKYSLHVGILSQNAENVSQRLLVKRKPLFFVDAVSQLNEAQINSVKEMGFESVLHYRIDYIPSRLAFCLLKSFDEEKCMIKLCNGKKIHITEEDVELVYGFPRGDIAYCREKWKSNVPFMRELAEQCDTKPANVNHKAVEQLMLADQEGGPQFKRLFLALLESALIEPSTCGMIKSKIGEIVDDLDNVRNINWCSYTISVLKFAMKNWSKTEKNAFAGPLPFLMEDKPETFDRWKTISESILLAQKEKEALEDLAEFPTFKTPRFLDKYAEQGNRENIPTSPVSDPKGAAEEGEGTKEDTVVDDSNESASPILPPAAGPTDDAYVETNKEKQQDKWKEKEENIVKNFNVTNRPDNWDGSTAKKNFISQIDNEIQRRPDFNWREIDLVFFPVCANFHYYLIVYWMKKNTIEIIDNNKPHKAMDPFEKYDIDVGLMTYVGKKGSEWDIGFSRRSVKIPQILRGRYCYTMISSIYNSQRSPMLQLAHDWMEVNMEKLLELNNKYKELFSRRKK